MPKAKVKRTSTWEWLDDDWSVLKTLSASGWSPAPAQSAVLQDNNVLPAPSLGKSHGARPLSGPFALGTSPPAASQAIFSPDDALTAGARAHSLAEQAFTKGLERLKARTTSPSGVSASKPAMSSPAKQGETRQARTGSQASEDIKEEISGMSDLAVEQDGVRRLRSISGAR